MGNLINNFRSTIQKEDRLIQSSLANCKLFIKNNINNKKTS